MNFTTLWKRLWPGKNSESHTPPPDFEAFREGVDAWMKDVSAVLVCVGNDLESCAQTINNNAEETVFQYEQLCRLEEKVDRLEEQMMRTRQAIARIPQHWELVQRANNGGDRRDN